MKFSKFKIIPLTLLLFFSLNSSVFSFENLQKWNDFIRSKNSKKIITWLKLNSYSILSDTKSKKIELKNIKIPPFYGQLGIFITLIKSNKVRGCYGSFYHNSENINLVLLNYLKNALRSDYRYKPIAVEELEEMKIIITITSQPMIINDFNIIDISRYGVLIKSENRSPLVLVPSEIKTHSYINKLIKKYNNPEISVFKALTLK